MIYAAREGEDSGVYFSPNSGANWFPSELQVWIDQLVFVSNANSRILYAAGVDELFKIDLSKGQMVIRLRSPGELRVYDSQGRVTGLVNGEIREEIPYSVYDEENKIVTIIFATDSYRYEVVGTDEGSYDVIVTSVADEVSTFTLTNVPTSARAVHQYTIDWDALAKGEKGVTMKIDSDGDGTFEEVKYLGQERIGFSWVWIVVVGLSALLGVLAGAFMVWRRIGRKEVTKG